MLKLVAHRPVAILTAHEKNYFFKLLMVVFLFSSLFVHGGVTLAGQVAKVQWTATIEIPPAQLSDMPDPSTEIAAAMRFSGIQANIKNGMLALSGSQGIEQLRSALFDDAAESMDFLGGPVELTLALPAGNQPVTLQLEARLTTGYRWEVVAAKGSRYIQQDKTTSEMRYAGIGAPAIQTIQLDSTGTGDGTVRLVYRRPFEKKNVPFHARVNLKISTHSGLVELTDPTPNEPFLEDANPSNNQSISNQKLLLPSTALPTAYDARSLGIVPPVRDQGSCGSCWAFGTVGVMEIALKNSGGPLADLSEQFLVSCNIDGWSCNGGLTASRYHYNTKGIAQTTFGAVLESDKPYTASNGSCAVAYSHPYKASSWQFITGSEWTMPTNDQIKNAIMTYGGVTAGVCVDNGWYNYTGGVYASSSNICSGSTNHQIVLVGWNDATQSWLLRNSWGTSWGENGYMRIKYDPAGTTSRVGEGSSWIAVSGSPSVFSLSVSKTGSGTVTSNPAGINCGTTACSANFASASSVILTATPSAGYRIGSWGGACSGIANTCTVSMNAAKSVIIQFVQSTITPAAPSTLAATAASSTQVNLTWVDKSSNETGFTVERKVGVNGVWSSIANLGANVTTYSNAGLLPSTTYYYRVRAYNGSGNSGYSNEVTVTTLVSLPDFVVTNITLNPASPRANSTFSATVTVKNQGTASGDGGWLDAWTNQSNVPTCGADGNQYKAVGTLGAGAIKTVTFSGLTTARTAGAKTFRVYVDSFCQKSESNEVNNQSAKTYTAQ